MVVKCTKYDLLQIPSKQGQIYYVTDIRCLYKDYGPHVKDRGRLAALILNTEYERANKIRPQNGRLYYVIESNNLWVYDAKWVLKDGDVRKYNAYAYSGTNSITPVLNTSGDITSNTTGDRIIDNNGLLGDGSVVIRDLNRIIRGQLSLNNPRNELAITSYQDNGITLYPYGLESNPSSRLGLGSLHLGVESNEEGSSLWSSMSRRGKATYYGDFYILGDSYNQSVIPVEDYTLSYIPASSQKLSHKFVTSKSEEESTRHYDFDITVISDTEAKVKITNYVNTINAAVTGADSEMLYDGTFVWGSEMIYDAIRTSDSDSNVSYLLEGTDKEIRISLEGNPYSAVVTINTDDFSDGIDTVYAKTELLDIQKLVSIKELEMLNTRIDELESVIAELKNQLEAR